MDSADKTFSPPYNVPFQTVMTTIEKIAADLPNKVDRSYLGSASGSVKSYLIGAFKGFGLIADDLSVTDDLKALATETDRRAEIIGDLLRKHYPQAVTLGTTNATMGELDGAFTQMFPSITGESRTKAIRFFLSAAEYADIPRSPLWKSPKAGTTGPRRGRPRKQPQVAPVGPEVVAASPSPPAIRSLREFTLPSGRVLALSLDGDPLALDRADRKFVMEIVDKIEDHIEPINIPSTASDVAPAGEPPEGPQ